MTRVAAFGAELSEAGLHLRLWAPARKHVVVRFDDGHRQRMRRDAQGFFEALRTDGRAGMRYCFDLDADGCVPDPASRFQPDDVHGPSEVIDPSAYAWTDQHWRGRAWQEALIYELHVGCFSPAGDYDGVRRRLDHLQKLGVTAIELMPVADFQGRRNWGYDGVLPYAPDSSYGRPDALKRLVDASHARGLMVVLDVVYNHFGPAGNYLARYAPDFFHPEIHTPWGAALAFDNPVLRRFFIENALYWLREYHFDGLRLDAVHALEDVPGGETFLRELAQRVRQETQRRIVHLVLENDRNEAHWLSQAKTQRLYAAQWNDDFHHAAHVLATGEGDGYYADYVDSPVRHLARSIAEGFDYQGEPSVFRDGRCRGEPSAGIRPEAFVNFLQNHDQVGNRALGERLSGLASPRRLRALYVLLLLTPHVPLLFMGEEWGASTPFLYFCDFPGDLGEAVREGRRSEFQNFDAFRGSGAPENIPDPNLLATFERARLDWDELAQSNHADWYVFIRRLIACRREHLGPLSSLIGRGVWQMTGEAAFAAWWRVEGGGMWRVEANLGTRTITLPAVSARVVYAELVEGLDFPPDGVRVSLSS